MQETEQIKSYGNSEELCARIIEDAKAQAALLLIEADNKAVQIKQAAQREASLFAQEFLAIVQKELIDQEKKSLTEINLQTRRIILNIRENIVDMIIGSTKNKAASFRSHESYAGYLRQAVIEGVDVVACPKVIITGSVMDAAIFNESFLNSIRDHLREVYSGDAGLEFVVSSDEQDIGVVVQSQDKRIKFDNRFMARLLRQYELVRVNILKEVFGENV